MNQNDGSKIEMDATQSLYSLNSNFRATNFRVFFCLNFILLAYFLFKTLYHFRAFSIQFLSKITVFMCFSAF